MGTSAYSKPAGRANKYFEPYMKDFQYADNISNKTVVITGTTSGTGYALARECLKLKATVVCLNRLTKSSYHGGKFTKRYGGRNVKKHCL